MSSPEVEESRRPAPPVKTMTRVTRPSRCLLQSPPTEGIITSFGLGGEPARVSSAKLRADRRKSKASSADDDQSGDDTDLEDGPIDTVHKAPSQKSPEEMYCAACRHNQLSPLREFQQQLGGKKIELKHKSLGPKDLAPIVIALLHDLNVNHLLLPGNNIGERGINFIAEMMSENIDIRTLDVSDNRLGQPGAIALGAIISSNDNLRQLSASGNEFYEKDVYYIVNAMQTNFTLKFMNLSHNEFREEGGILLGHMLEKNEGLEVLDLSWNHLRMKGAAQICHGVALNTTLVHLDLAWNGLSNEGAAAMADALKVNNTLESLDLTNNRISAKGALALAGGLALNQSLQILRLRQNPISTIGALHLLCGIRDNENSSIIELDIEDVPVTYDFEVVLNDIVDKRGNFQARHGEFVTAPDVVGARLLSMEAMKIDPFKLLMVYAQKEGLRLWDVFAQFDKDGSLSISPQEFKHAIKTANIQLTDKQVESLVTQLDKDGDGEVDFKELVEAQREYIIRERKMKIRQVETDEKQRSLVRKRLDKWNARQGTLDVLLPGGSEPLPRAREKSPEHSRPVLRGGKRPTSAGIRSLELLALSSPTRRAGSAASGEPEAREHKRLNREDSALGTEGAPGPGAEGEAPEQEGGLGDEQEAGSDTDSVTQRETATPDGQEN